MRPKSKFLTFVLALFPGAGHMYLGFMKQGVELMVMFLALCMLTSIMGIGLGVFIPLFIAYSIFDALKKRNYNVPPNDNSDLDVFYWFGFKAPTTQKNLKRRKVLAFVIMLLGAYLIVDGIVFSGLRQLAWYWDETGIFYDIQSYLRVLIVAGLLIFGGVKLLKHVDSIDPEEIPEDVEEKIPVYYQNPAANQSYPTANQPVPPRPGQPYTQTPPYSPGVPPRYPAGGYQQPPYNGRNRPQPGPGAGAPPAGAGAAYPGAVPSGNMGARSPYPNANVPAPGTPGRPVTGKGKVDIDAIIREAAASKQPAPAGGDTARAEERTPSAATPNLPQREEQTSAAVSGMDESVIEEVSVSAVEESAGIAAHLGADDAPDKSTADAPLTATDAPQAELSQPAGQDVTAVPSVKETDSQEQIKQILEGKGGER